MLLANLKFDNKYYRPNEQNGINTTPYARNNKLKKYPTTYTLKGPLQYLDFTYPRVSLSDINRERAVCRKFTENTLRLRRNKYRDIGRVVST